MLSAMSPAEIRARVVFVPHLAESRRRARRPPTEATMSIDESSPSQAPETIVSPEVAAAMGIEHLAINTIRTLSMDAVQAANSGHPGTPMALAPVAYTVWQNFLRFDPADPTWPARDRFVYCPYQMARRDHRLQTWQRRLTNSFITC